MWHHGFESKWDIVRAIYTKSHFNVMDVYFILIKFCYFISMRIYMSYVCIYLSCMCVFYINEMCGIMALSLSV